MTNVLLTGVTGTLGSAVFSRMLADRSLGVRAIARSGGTALEARGVQTLSMDLHRLDPRDPETVAFFADVDVVVNMAADVRWNQPRAAAITANADTVSRLLACAAIRADPPTRFVQVSTAFVASPTGCQDCRNGQGPFNNSYEESKFAGEQHVVRSGLPFTILRPSMIVGASDDGSIEQFNGIYYIVQAIAGGLVPFLVGDPRGHIDLVAIDTVVDAILKAVARQYRDDSVVRVLAHPDGLTLSQTVDIAVEEINRFRAQHGVDPVEAPALISCRSYRQLYLPFMRARMGLVQRKMLEIGEQFHPYLSMQTGFATAPFEEVEHSPPTAGYYSNCIRYWCIANPDRALARPYRWARGSANPELTAATI